MKIQKIDENQWLERLKKLDELRDLVFENLVLASDKQKQKYNQGRKDVTYFIGDKILLKTHTLSGASKGFNAKLSPPLGGSLHHHRGKSR